MTPSTSFAGTAPLARLALRLDRLRLTAWVATIALLPAATAAQYKKLYPTDDSVRQVADVITNPSLVAMNGQLYRASLGGLTAWKISATALVLAGLMNLLTITRHTRTEEETGRLELLGSHAVGRHAPLTAALAVTTIANTALAALTTLVLIATGLPAAGSLTFGLAIGAFGAVMATIAAIAAQLTASARTANAIAAATLGACYALRAIGDTGPAWLSWTTPIGWAMRTRPYAGENWAVLALIAALAAAAATAAYTLNGHRDQGAGLIAQRRGPARAAPTLSGPIGLAWRLQRGLFAGWAIGLTLAGFAVGGVTKSVSENIGENDQITQMLSKLGGETGLTDMYLSAVLGIIGVVTAAYTVQATLRPRAEETAGRVEPILATSVSRIRLAASHLAFAIGGTTTLLALAGATTGLAHGLATGDVAGQVPRLTAATLAQAPATWVLAGLGAALFGLAPRLTGLTWAALAACLLLMDLGALLDLNQRLIDLSPFAHVPKLPGADFTATPMLWLTAAAAALTTAGLAGFRRRDLG